MNMERILGHNPVVQMGYYVPDLEQAVAKHAGLFGSGPYYLVKNLQSEVVYRGQPKSLNLTTAFGQWGDIQVEFVQQNSPGPSYFTEMHGFGLHHFAVFVDDLKAAIAEFEEWGCEAAGCGMRPDGSLQTALIDCRDILGHYVELYAADDKSTHGLFAAVRKMADGWDGKGEILRTSFG